MNKKIILIIFGALFFPLMIGVLSTLVTIKDVMLHSEPSPLDGLEKTISKKSDWNPDRKKALILLGHQATSTLEFLASFEILTRSGFDVKVAGFKHELHSLTSSIGVFPDGSLEDFSTPDLLVIPSFVGDAKPVYSAQIAEMAADASWVLLHGQGAAIIAPSFQLDSHQVSISALAMDHVKKNYPKVEWRNLAFSISGKYVSSSGLFQSLAATKWVATQIIKMNSEDKKEQEVIPPSLKDYAHILLHTGFDWFKTNIGVLIYPNINELGLAAALEVYPRSFSARAVTLAENRTLIKSENGLTLVPTLAIRDTPLFDLLVVPHGSPEVSPLSLPEVTRMSNSQEFFVKDLTSQDPQLAFEDHLKILAKTKGQVIAQTVQRFLQIEPPIKIPFGKRSYLWHRPIILMIMGALIALFLLNLFKKNSSPKKRSKNT